MPGRIRLDFGGETMTPRRTTKTLEAEASVSFASRKRIVSAAPACADIWRSSTLPMSEIDLMSQRNQRLSTALTAGAPLSTCHGGRAASGFDIINTLGPAFAGKEWSR